MITAPKSLTSTKAILRWRERGAGRPVDVQRRPERSVEVGAPLHECGVVRKHHESTNVGRIVPIYALKEDSWLAFRLSGDTLLM